VVQRQRELAQHQRNGVVAGGELEPARQDAQIGVHIGLQRHRTGVEQGAPLGAASVVVSLVVVILGTVRSCAPAIRARQREQPESRIINKLDDNGHPTGGLFQLQG
jgi:hypothetical protein